MNHTNINTAVTTVAEKLAGRTPTTPTIDTVVHAIIAAARHHSAPVDEIATAKRIQAHISQHIADVTMHVDTLNVLGERVPALYNWLTHDEPSPAEMTREIYAAAAKVYGDIYGH